MFILYKSHLHKLLYISLTMQNEYPNTVSLKIATPQLKSELGGASKHHIYPISGQDDKGQFSILRRYSDFDLLRTVLVARWPGCFIPCLPQKKFLGNNEAIFVQIRRQGLQCFLKILSQRIYFWYSQEMQVFLRNSGDCQKALTKLKDSPLKDILEKYKQNFPCLFEKQISKDLNNKIIQFSQYLKQASGLLQNLEKMTQQAFNTRRKYNEKYVNMLQFVLPEYEKNCLNTYKTQNDGSQLIFKGQDNICLQTPLQDLRNKKQQNSVIYVLEEIKRQKLELMACQEILKAKQNFGVKKQKAISKVKDLQIEAGKINAGKQSLFSKITNKSKEQQLKENQNQILKATQEQKNLALLCQVIVALLGYSQIDHFKKIRQRAYYSLLRKFFEIEKQDSRMRRRFWTEVGKNKNVKIEVDGSEQFLQVQKNEVNNFLPNQDETAQIQADQNDRQIDNQLQQTNEQPQNIQKTQEKQNPLEKQAQSDNLSLGDN